jgi:hypothetical protein
MKKALLLLILTMPAKAEWNPYVAFWGFSNHDAKTVEIAPGFEVEPSLNEINIGYGLGLRMEKPWFEVWGELGGYHNSFKRNSKYGMVGIRFNAGSFRIGPTIGGADGYGDVEVCRIHQRPMCAVQDRDDTQELAGLSIRSGGAIFLYHPNVTLLRFACDFDMNGVYC